MSERILNLNANEHFSSLCHKLDEMRKEKENCDFTIKVGSEEFPVHKSIIGAASDYFRAMMSHDTIETQTGVVELKEVDADAVKRCIHFIYTGECSVNPGCEEKLIHVAHLLQLPKLCEAIVESLEKNLDCGTFFVAKKIADTYNYKKLGKNCDKLALDNLDSILEGEGFKDLDQKYILFLVASDSKFKTDGRCQFLIEWISRDLEVRKVFFCEMFQCLKITEISISYRRYLLQNETLVRDCSKCYNLIMNSVWESVSVLCQKPTIYEAFIDDNNAIAVFDKTSGSLRTFQPQTKQWKTLKQLDDRFTDQEFSAVVLHENIYVFCQQNVYSLNYPNGQAVWKQVESLLENHGQCPSVLSFEDSFYVIGSSLEPVTKTVECYNIRNNCWSKKSDRELELSGSALVKCNEYIYAIGGAGTDGFVKADVERYCPRTDQWKAVSNLDNSRQSPSAIALDGFIYVCGGYAGEPIASVECYDVDNNVWSSIAPMCEARWGFINCLIDGKIFAVGDFEQKTKTIEMFDVEKKSWEIVEKFDNMEIVPRASVAIKFN